ncbi:MAG: DUF1854 domain-containing protein [Comamonadaceae bacterium]|nr:MAG: DUF1854 domain-containing protein [Comamonadaceae bacterium]
MNTDNHAAVAGDAAEAPDFELTRDRSGRLAFVGADGRRETGVVPVRAFPLAAPDEGISIVGADGRELGWVADLRAVPATLRELLHEELSLRDFMPVITRLVSVSTFSTPSVWTVETDRGPTTFVLKGEEDIRRLGRAGLLIAGSEGVQYSVVDMTLLDRGSRKLLGRFL